jgi:hypothetical protein
MLVRHGRLFGVMGQPCQARELFFCPALVEIDDPADCHLLVEAFRPPMGILGGFCPEEPAAGYWEHENWHWIFGPPPDGLWVRSRLPVVFGYRPLHLADGREHLLDHGFVAVLDAGTEPTAVPFACATTHCSESRLVMSRSEEPAVRSRVARCFWELLSERGGDGQDFRAEDLELTYDYDYDGSEELLTEVGRTAGRYYADTTAWDAGLDPNCGRPDYSAGQWQCQWSRRIRRIRRCL